MTEYGTIKIPANAYEQHNENRQDLGLTWEDYIDGQAPEGIDEDDLARRITDQIGSTVGGPRVDDSEIAALVAQKIDYVQVAEQVSERIVNELEGRR